MITTAIAYPNRPRPFRIVTLVALGALLVAACGNPPSPSPTASQSATPSPAPSSAPPSGLPTDAACTSADIAATGGPWGGAAGSRGADILVENRGAAACLLPAGTTIALVDRTGAILLANTPVAVGTGPSIASGGSIGFTLVLGNWCSERVSLPLHLSLALATDAVDVDNLAVTSTDELPPCNGPGQPATLSTTGWEPR